MSTMTKIITDLRKRLTGATGALHDEIARLRGEIIRVRKELDAARRAPLLVAEIVADRIPQVVAEHGRLWLDDHGHALVGGERSLGSPDPKGSRRLPWFHTDPIPWGLLCAAAPEFARDLLAAAVQAVPFEAGPAMRERPSAIARLQLELEALEQTEVTLIDEAAASGVIIAHRPEVQRAREHDARRRELEERAARERAAHEAEINRRMEEAARIQAVPSGYLLRERKRPVDVGQ